MSGITVGTAALFASIASAAIGAGVSGYELANQPKAPTAPTMLTNQTEQARSQQEAALAQAQALQRRRGMSSTVLTSPLGTQSAAQTQQATLGT